MRVVEISDTAKDDLRNIWEYVAQYNSESANKLIKEITKKFPLLRDYPLMEKLKMRFSSTCEVLHSRII